MKVNVLQSEYEISSSIVYAPDHLQGASLEATLNCLRDCRELLENRLLETGHLLFKGFSAVQQAQDFGQFSSAFSSKFMTYEGGISPRKQVCDHVMTSTDLDRRFPIELHQELSYQTRFPDKVAFFCQIAPQVGGETPIVDMRKVYGALPQDLINRFEQKQLRVNRRFPLEHKQAKFIKSWQATFQTDSLDDLEKIVHQQGGELNIKNEYVEVINQVTSATIIHPITKEKIWFNQASIFHQSTFFYWAKKYRAWYFWLIALIAQIRGSDFYTICTYGDGTNIDAADLNIIRKAIDQYEICRPWHEGDILLLENRIMAHGRRPYKGDRKVLAALLSVP